MFIVVFVSIFLHVRFMFYGPCVFTCLLSVFHDICTFVLGFAFVIACILIGVFMLILMFTHVGK